MNLLMAGNENYGLAKSIKNLFPNLVSLSRSSGYNLSKTDTRCNIAEMSLNFDVFLLVSALGDFNQTQLLKEIALKWQEKNHRGYIIAIGSSADTPVKGTSWIYPVEKKALRAYCRQLSQIVASESPPNWKITYLSPGNLNTPRQEEKLPGVPKLDCEYVVKIIGWLISQPPNVNISEICLDQIQIKCV